MSRKGKERIYITVSPEESSNEQEQDSAEEFSESESIEPTEAPAEAPKNNGAKIAFICLVGNFSGDIWHLAAAQILWRNLPSSKKTSFHFSDLQPEITISGFKKPDGSRSVPETKSVQRGKGSFIYMDAIGYIPTLVSVPGEGLGSNPENANTFYLSYDLVLKRYRRRDSELHNFYQIMEEQPDIPKKKEGAPSPGRISENPNFISLWASTSLVMQLMSHYGVIESLITLNNGLSANLGAPQPNGQVPLLTAIEQFRRLLQVIRDAQAKTRWKKVLLLNYRIGDVNTQHDTNDNILRQLMALAAQKQMVVISVLMIDPTFWAERTDKSGKVIKFLKDLDSSGPEKMWCFDVFGLINPIPNFVPDKRNIARVWSYVADYLQERTLDYDEKYESVFGTSSSTSQEIVNLRTPLDPQTLSEAEALKGCVHGLIGGRSGSMDLPAFVGVNCMSWDEPVFTNSYTSAQKRVQGPQLLRLLNELPVMRTCYLDRRTKRKVKKKVVYNKLTYDTILESWLDTPKELNIATYENAIPQEEGQAEALLELIKTYRNKVSNAAMGISPIYLQHYESAIEEYRSRNKKESIQLVVREKPVRGEKEEEEEEEKEEEEGEEKPPKRVRYDRRAKMTT